jgi:dTDP-4-dehydrorhamnose 3,5-epimerase
MLAIGYQTLTDDSEVIYQLGEFYTPEYECGLRHDDPAFGIEWPLPVTEISRKDASWPLFESIPTGV